MAKYFFGYQTTLITGSCMAADLHFKVPYARLESRPKITWTTAAWADWTGRKEKRPRVFSLLQLFYFKNLDPRQGNVHLHNSSRVKTPQRRLRSWIPFWHVLPDLKSISMAILSSFGADILNLRLLLYKPPPWSVDEWALKFRIQQNSSKTSSTPSDSTDCVVCLLHVSQSLLPADNQLILVQTQKSFARTLQTWHQCWAKSATSSSPAEGPANLPNANPQPHNKPWS